MKTVIWILAILLLLAAGLFAAGWVLSSRVLVPTPYGLMPEFNVIGVKDTPGAAPWPPAGLPARLVETTADLPSQTVVLPAPESDLQFANTLAGGVYGLMWEGGNGVLGEVLSRIGGQVERELRVLSGTPPAPGMAARMDNFIYRTNPAELGLEYEELTLAGPVGNLRGWFVPADGGTAVLMLHGRRRGELSELLRPIASFNQLGLPALALAYRNHAGSDPSPDGLYHYGASEWEDALVGARELRARGYDRVVVYGISMGGAIALEALKRWPPDAPQVVGVVLDSPLIDPYPVVELGAVKAGMPLPGLLTRLGLAVGGVRAGINFSSLRQYLSGPSIHVPVLLIGGDADTTVPIEAIDRFAQSVGAPLTYMRITAGEHVEAWNHSPAQYTEWLRLFLASLNVSA